MNKLNSFLIEQAEIEKKNIKVLILTTRKLKDNKVHKKSDNYYRTVKRFVEECDKAGIFCYTVFTENAYIDKDENGKTRIHNVSDKRGVELNSKNTVAIVRGSVANQQTSLDLLSVFDKHNIFCINSRRALEECSDKYRTVLTLADANLPCPRTALVTDERSLELSFQKVGGQFPVVLKTTTGAKGIGVFIADTFVGLKSTLQTIWKLAPGASILMQDKIDADYDLRIHVLGGKVIAVMKRSKIDGDFRSNYSLGGKIEKATIPDEFKNIAIKASKAVGAVWCGVDLMIDRDGNPFILEINSSPGTEGIEKSTGLPVVNMVLDYATDKNNWQLEAQECGYIEAVHIKKLGLKLKAKMDTGNGSESVLHADKYVIKNGKIVWFHNEKKYINDVVGHKKVRLSNGQVEERPIIELDILFNGTVYKNIKFLLYNRKDMSTPLLMGRGFIKLAKLSINPARRFVLSLD